jgi:hypothetical protein
MLVLHFGDIHPHPSPLVRMLCTSSAHGVSTDHQPEQLRDEPKVGHAMQAPPRSFSPPTVPISLRALRHSFGDCRARFSEEFCRALRRLVRQRCKIRCACTGAISSQSVVCDRSGFPPKLSVKADMPVGQSGATADSPPPDSAHIHLAFNVPFELICGRRPPRGSPEATCAGLPPSKAPLCAKAARIAMPSTTRPRPGPQRD